MSTHVRSSISVSPCEQPKKVGPCYAIKPRFYYNQETGQCESFDWGGCQPNGNNFETIGMCVAMCLGQGMYRPFQRDRSILLIKFMYFTFFAKAY